MIDFITYFLPNIIHNLLHLVVAFFIVRLIIARVHWSSKLILTGIVMAVISSVYVAYFSYNNFRNGDFDVEDQSNTLAIINFFSGLGYVLQVIGYSSFFSFIYKNRERLSNPMNGAPLQIEIAKNDENIID